MAKVRLDELMVRRGLASDRRGAAALLMGGAVLVDGRKDGKPGTLVEDQIEIRPLREDSRYVSRGGLKLEAALRHFAVDVRGWICLDLGASTGGFTDCLLRRGAARVFAFDVGRGLIDWRLRNDPRVALREGFNVRFLMPEDVGAAVRLITADLSFISLRLILPALKAFQGAELLLLVKPQFEAEPEEVEPGGLVRLESKREEIVGRVARDAAGEGFAVVGTMPSPVLGQKGNREYFLFLRNS
jgi:23S rRNA (cytidine1920-2'-O)/16S rRNA (cytidine1409-2'-O)-methyltransferase